MSNILILKANKDKENDIDKKVQNCNWATK